MSSYEIMLSESQERMLLVADKGREQEVLDIFAKWGLDASIVGIVTADDTMRVTHHGELVCEIPNKALTDEAPVYHRPVGVWKAPVPMDPPTWVLKELKKPRDYTADLKKLLASANICSKRWVFEQYDSMVQTNTVQGPGGEAGVMRIKGTGHRAMHTSPSLDTMMPGVIGFAPLGSDETDVIEAAKGDRGLAMALAGNGRWTYLDPKLGAMHAVAEAARKVACTGAKPVAATNCLNFGNPEKPEIMAQLSQAIDGIAEACTALGTPVTGGNVSLYNETKGEGIYPTPVIGIVGIIEDVTKAVPSGFQREGDAIILLSGVTSLIPQINLRAFGSSEFAKSILGTQWGGPPPLDLDDDEPMLQQFLIRLSQEGLLHSACDVSDGGIAVAIARATFAHGIGASIDLSDIDETRGKHPLSHKDVSSSVLFFAECSSQAIVTCDPANVDRVCKEFGVIAVKIGETTSRGLEIRYREAAITSSLNELSNEWSTALESQLAAEVLV
jgi:phosphoribosylformylglycinamidine (FGAM) synthase-like enzyme